MYDVCVRWNVIFDDESQSQLIHKIVVYSAVAGTRNSTNKNENDVEVLFLQRLIFEQLRDRAIFTHTSHT